MTASVDPSFAPELLSVRDEVPTVRTFRFASPSGFVFTPGQFLLLYFEDDPKTKRAYSLCSSPLHASRYLEISVGSSGSFSERLSSLVPGARHGLRALGPLGRWTYDGTPPHAVLVSGGTGLAPYRAMCLLKVEGRTPGRITLICSARTPETLLFREEYATWEKAGIAVRPRVTRPQESSSPWTGPTGRWTSSELLTASDGDPRAVYYLCGPNAMVSALRNGLMAQGVPVDKVRVERWGDYPELI